MWATLVDSEGWVHTIPWDERKQRPAPFHALDLACSCFPSMVPEFNAPLARRIVMHHDARWPGHNPNEELRLS